MELTKEILNKERIVIEDILSKACDKDNIRYKDMTFAINLYYKALLRHIEHKTD